MTERRYLLDAATQRAIVTHLEHVPRILHDLETTRTRQDQHTNPYAPRVRNGSDEQPLPVNLAATDADRHLRWLIGSWVQHTLDHRGLEYHRPGARPSEPDTTEGAAAWLSAHVADLAQTPNADCFLPALIWALDNAATHCDRPGKPEHDTTTDPRQAAARIAHQLHPAATCARILATLVDNPPSRDLIRKWGTRGHITTHRDGSGNAVYRIGEVLDACLAQDG